jgi:hypothetical protein
MAQKIPLNKFKSLFRNDLTTTRVPVYVAQNDRATILLNCQATNTTSTNQTISMYVSSWTEGNVPTSGVYEIVKDLAIPPKDARSLVTGRLVLRGIDTLLQKPDSLLLEASSPGVVVSIGLLEAVNKD